MTLVIFELETFLDFVLYLLTPAGVGAAVYFIVEKLPFVKGWFESLMAEYKRLFVLGLCVALPLAATGAGMGLGYFPVSVDTVYTALRIGVEAYLASQLIHIRDLRAKRC